MNLHGTSDSFDSNEDAFTSREDSATRSPVLSPLRGFTPLKGTRVLGRPTSLINLNESQRSGLVYGSQQFQPSHIPPLTNQTTSSLPHEGFSARNEEWKSVQHAVISLFQQKKIHTGSDSASLRDVNEHMRDLVKSDIGPFIYQYYKDHLLKKGMTILRGKIEHEEGQDLVDALGSIWTYFFGEILPMIQVIFHPIKTEGLPVRQLTIVGFRDIVLLKTGLQDLLEDNAICIPASVEQMLLIILTVHTCDFSPVEENYLRVEEMAAQIVTPYIGVKGLYTGNKTPEFEAIAQDESQHCFPGIMKAKSAENILQERPHLSVTMQLFPLHVRQSSTPIINSVGSTLETLPEGGFLHHSRDRRHSSPYNDDEIEATI